MLPRDTFSVKIGPVLSMLKAEVIDDHRQLSGLHGLFDMYANYRPLTDALFVAPSSPSIRAWRLDLVL